jgi:hypothetical protein
MQDNKKINGVRYRKLPLNKYMGKTNIYLSLIKQNTGFYLLNAKK